MAQITTYGVVCGQAAYAEHMAKALKDLVSLLILAEKEEGLEGGLRDGIEIRPCWRRDEADFVGLKAQEDFDIAHIQHEWGLFGFPRGAGGIYRIIAGDDDRLPSLLREYKKKGKHIVLTLHTSLLQSEWTGPYLRSLPVDKFIVQSSPREMDLMKEYGIADRAIFIPHPIVPMALEDPKTARAKLGLESFYPVILITGFYRFEQRMEDSIRAFAIIKREFPDAILIFAGRPHPKERGAIREYLRGNMLLAKRLGIGPNDIRYTNKFHGEEELARMYSAADILLSTRRVWPHSFSVSAVALRGVASMKPLVLLRDVGNELLPDWVVARADTVEELADLTIKILRDKDLYGKYVEAERRYYEENNWPTIAKRYYLPLYEGLMD